MLFGVWPNSKVDLSAKKKLKSVNRKRLIDRDVNTKSKQQETFHYKNTYQDRLFLTKTPFIPKK
ncbi:MAG: hypothetical protein ACI96G_000250 [Flavobacterium sp.]|jgi:hypothetical protein